MELIKQAMKCLENNVKQCVLRLIEDLIKNQCHNGNVVGKEVADEVRELVHRLWLRNNDEERCELLRMLKSLNVSRTWAMRAVHRSIYYLDELLASIGRTEQRGITLLRTSRVY
jgi:predicted  nucleic acid-binding Zn ribbon protein